MTEGYYIKVNRLQIVRLFQLTRKYSFWKRCVTIELDEHFAKKKIKKLGIPQRGNHGSLQREYVGLETIGAFNSSKSVGGYTRRLNVPLCDLSFPGLCK